MKNPITKVFVALTGVLGTFVAVLFFKMQRDEVALQKIQEALATQADNNAQSLELLATQKQIQDANQQKLDRVAQATVGQKSVISTQTTVIPGKTVKQTKQVPVTQQTTRSS
ncbi:hypothetical protein EPO05_01610 [Patescibacteria group bacterium]|nr:MAG: hypothetical protein EPO05_01610 [Patescibacteria group bacterium]